MTNSFNSKDCNGCKHQLQINGQWCYMFGKKPNILPCAQHDVYKDLRNLTGKLIKNNPEIIKSLIL